ncbi:pilus assembly PilX N-terminal domain-containing protein [Thalassotalea marina]|uniref:Type 4 fimbrial biogenesis protein PilX N-terminal domain-containing protein n=1 Tax=Thalassotalea marina TaxID=1673741 RepID=A0A919BCC8_9GAMM|nr:pilus assembly PilX N-terminal domain-containing protein [Thalassotalea marina]GHF82871.1 hypothetical protein GCM10017161_07630 [Thalassotalea marina]
MFLKDKYSKHRGSSLVIAIFIIIVLSLLGVALVRMNSTSAQSVVYEVVGTRAFQAAQSGMQLHLQKLFPLSGSGSAECRDNLPVISFNHINGLEGCQAAITCLNKTDYYLVTSQGSCTVGARPWRIQVAREIEVQAQDIK